MQSGQKDNQGNQGNKCNQGSQGNKGINDNQDNQDNLNYYKFRMSVKSDLPSLSDDLVEPIHGTYGMLCYAIGLYGMV